MRHVLTALVLGVLAACGGSTGESTGGSTVASGKVSVEISSQAASPSAVLYAVDLALHLPVGVTVATAPGGEVLPGALHPVDTAALTGASFTPAGAGQQGVLRVVIADPVGFAVGPLASVDCTVAPGAVANSATLTLTAFSARDVDGVPLPGVTASIAVKAR